MVPVLWCRGSGTGAAAGREDAIRGWTASHLGVPISPESRSIAWSSLGLIVDDISNEQILDRRGQPRAVGCEHNAFVDTSVASL